MNTVFHPYNYQSECLAAIEIARLAGYETVLCQMASSLGKTVTMGFDAAHYLSQNGGRILFLCHQNEILYQSKATFEAILGTEYSYGYFTGPQKDIHKVDCLFASFQTIERRLNKFSPNEFDYIMVDESHHSHARTYFRTIEYFKPKFLLGITATPDREDGNDIRLIYGEEVFKLSLVEALSRNLLTPVDYRLMTDEIQLKGILNTPRGKLSINYLNKTVFVPRRDREIAAILNKYLEEQADPRVIIFCSSVQHCEHLAKFIPNSLPIHSRIQSKERDVRLELFRQGLVQTILTVDCFNEGVDIPEINIVVFLRSTASKRIFLQQLGRGLRRAEGKKKVLVLDFAANCERIKTVYSLWKDVRKQRAKHMKNNKVFRKTATIFGEPITLNIDSVEFEEKIIPLLDLLKRISTEFYETWKEASTAAQELGIKTQAEYSQKYKQDDRLPSTAVMGTYPGFPGWRTFLDTKRKFYETWDKAGKAAQRLGIKSANEYAERYKEDTLLPCSPHQIYEDFPGWHDYLNNLPNFYPTWEKAAKSARALGIKSSTEYRKRYSEDPRLIGSPHVHYDNFPGWKQFLDTEPNFYPTWQEAGRAAHKLGISTSAEYPQMRKKDPRLPAELYRFYPGFPGWAEFIKA